MGAFTFHKMLFQTRSHFFRTNGLEHNKLILKNKKANKPLFVVGKETHNLVALLMSDDNCEKIDVFEASPWRYFKPAFVDGVMAGPNSICRSS